MKKVAVLLSLCMFLAISCKEEKEEECNDEIRLLEAIISSDSSIYRKFEYDEQNRITRMLTFTDGYELSSMFIYSGDELIKVVSDDFYYMGSNEYFFEKDGYEVEFTKSENKIIFTEKYNRFSDGVNTVTLDLDSVGYPSGINPGGMSGRSYSVMNDNLTNYNVWGFSSQGAGTSTERKYNYQYDNKKSIFYDCKTPRWYLIYAFGELGSKNNVTEIDNKGYNYYGSYRTITKIEYEYDCAGFPIKKSENDGTDKTVTTFKYKHNF